MSRAEVEELYVELTREIDALEAELLLRLVTSDVIAPFFLSIAEIDLR